MNKKTPLVSTSCPAGRRFATFVIAAGRPFRIHDGFCFTPQGTFEKTLQVNGPLISRSRRAPATSPCAPVLSGSVASSAARFMLATTGSRARREADVHAIEQNPPIHQEGNSIHVDYVNMRNISIDYEITVPTDTTIRARSGSGDQTIEGTKGNVDIQTGSGDVRLAHLTGEIHLQTGSGDVRAREIAGTVRGGTGSGDIEVEESGPGDIDLHTGSGGVTARGVQGGFRGETGSGDITAEGSQSGPWEIHTGSGNVRVKLPSNAAFDADISTSSGSVDVGEPVEMTVQGRIGEPQKSIRGKVHGGGQLLRVRTGSGDIHID